MQKQLKFNSIFIHQIPIIPISEPIAKKFYPITSKQVILTSVIGTSV